ncbi:melanoma cell adhesion molecule b isoform X3 [Gadus chalcogrammus]|uniref:melanoma cell adhesion molecule b isoform X3 n=1 Tax=Gadus chalcogrammus TaxID=1042646 RepID=UPI0024C4993A|nr:melanoma cell adhesion molecule b isoform X3 [Gadus chalcogrammus]
MALRTKTALLVGLLFLLHTWGVKAQVKVEMEDRVEVTLGTAAEIPCLYTTDDGFGGLIIEWFYLDPAGKQHRIYFQDPTMRIEETNSQFTGRIKVDVTPSQGSGQVLLRVLETRLGDEVDFICLVKSLTDGNDQGKTQLRVFEKPAHPIIKSVDKDIWFNNEEPVKIGSCEAKNGYPRPNITWYKDNTPLSNVPNEVSVVSQVATGSSGLFSVESELSLKVVKEDQGSEFYCEVNYQIIGGFGMLESEKKKIRVSYPSDEVNLWVKSPKRDIKEGDTVEFECLGNGNPQPLVTFRNREMVELNAINNVLELRNVSRLDSGLYECVTTHIETFEEVVGNTTLFVNYLEPADVSPEETLTLSQGADLNQSCNALSSLKTHTVWMKNGVKVATGNILSLRDVVYDMAGTYECMVTVPQLVGMETSAAFQLIVEGSPEISEPQSTSLEQAVESTVVLTCRARGNPRPTITWRSAGSLVDSQSNVTEDGVLSWVNVKVSSDLNVSCHASNTNGNVETLYSIKAIVPTTASPTTTLATVVPTTASPTTTLATVVPPTDRPASTVGTAGGSGVIIAVLIICLLLLAILGSVLYFLYKKGKICGRSGKQDLTKEKTSRDNIVVEMKSDNTEEAVLLAVNGDKKSGDQ